MNLLERVEQLTDGAPVTVVENRNRVLERTPGSEWKQTDGTIPGTDLASVLIYTPSHPAYGVRPQTWRSVRAAVSAYDGPVDWVTSFHDNPHMIDFENVERHHNKGRQKALDGGYDYLLSIEADMVVPEDVISRLIATDADIAYGLYVWRFKPTSWSAYTELNLFGGKSITFWQDEARQAWGQVVDVAGLGMGCTLIKRHVLEQVRFRLYDGNPDNWEVRAYGPTMQALNFDPHQSRKRMICTDWLLALDAAHHGFTQRCDLGAVCGHVTNEGVLWPDPDAQDLYRLEPADTGEE